MFERPLLRTLSARLAEPRRFIQVLVGPRQVGKTTLLGQLTDQIVHPGLLVRSLSADAVTSGDWLEQAWQDMRTAMRLAGATEGLLCVDEIQKVPTWSEVVKKNWDEDTRDAFPLRVVLSGSSRLLIADGLGESLAGRFELHHLGHWTYPEMRDAFGFSHEQYAWFGAYPGAVSVIADEPRFKNYIVDSIVEPSLSRDVLMLTRIDKPALLRQLFQVGTTYSGQILSFTKLLGQMEAGNTVTLSKYVRLLDEAGLLAGLEKHSTKPYRVKGSSPKFQTHNMALLSSLRSRTFEQIQADHRAWGTVVESAVGSHLLAGIAGDPMSSLRYWRDGNDEVDFVIARGDQVVGLEVKSASTRHATGLEAFRRAFPGASTVLIGAEGLSWRHFLDHPPSDVLSDL